MKRILIIFHFALFSTFSFAQIPYLEIQDTLGNNYLLSDYMTSDKIYLVNFWSKWCEPCEAEFNAWKNYTDSWINDYQVEILAIAIDHEFQHNAVKTFWDEQGWNGNLFFANSDSVFNAFDITGVPFLRLYDKSLNQVFSHLGFAPGDEMELDQEIKQHFTVEVIDIVKEEASLTVVQNANTIIIGLSNLNWVRQLNIYDLSGRLLYNHAFNSKPDDIIIPKFNLPSNQIIILKASGPNGTSISSLLFNI